MTYKDVQKIEQLFPRLGVFWDRRSSRAELLRWGLRVAWIEAMPSGRWSVDSGPPLVDEDAKQAVQRKVK